MVANYIIRSLEERPDEWTETHHRLIHQPTGMGLWVANGPFFVGDQDHGPVRVRLGPIERWRVWRAYRRWNRARVIHLLAPPAVEPVDRRPVLLPGTVVHLSEFEPDTLVLAPIGPTEEGRLYRGYTLEEWEQNGYPSYRLVHREDNTWTVEATGRYEQWQAGECKRIQWTVTLRIAPSPAAWPTSEKGAPPPLGLPSTPA